MRRGKDWSNKAGRHLPAMLCVQKVRNPELASLLSLKGLGISRKKSASQNSTDACIALARNDCKSIVHSQSGHINPRLDRCTPNVRQNDTPRRNT